MEFISRSDSFFIYFSVLASDRLLRKEYPTFRRRSLPDKQEDLVQSKLLQSISKIKSDKASVVNTGCKDGQGKTFLHE